MIRKVEVIYISIGTRVLGFPGGTVVKNLPAMQETQEMQVHLVRETPGSGISLQEGNGNPFQYSCLGNPVDSGARWATVHGLARVGHN